MPGPSIEHDAIRRSSPPDDRIPVDGHGHSERPLGIEVAHPAKNEDRGGRVELDLPRRGSVWIRVPQVKLDAIWRRAVALDFDPTRRCLMTGADESPAPLGVHHALSEGASGDLIGRFPSVRRVLELVEEVERLEAVDTIRGARQGLEALARARIPGLPLRGKELDGSPRGFVVSSAAVLDHVSIRERVLEEREKRLDLLAGGEGVASLARRVIREKRLKRPVTLDPRRQHECDRQHQARRGGTREEEPET
jgi:hypothetical protein